MELTESESMVSSLTLTVNWRLTLLGALLLPLLLALGFWQLQRAGEKSRLLEGMQRQRALAPVEIRDDRFVNLPHIQYRRVAASGRFRADRYYLLDNRVMAGRVGYEVIAPLQIEGARWLLVNLGWVAAPPLRSEYPDIVLPQHGVRVEGYAALPSRNRLLGGDAWPDAWPLRIQQVDMERLAGHFDGELYPWILRIDAHSEHAFGVAWREINTTPAKHYGYAVQWFAMAAVLCIALLVVNTNLVNWMKHKLKL